MWESTLRKLTLLYPYFEPMLVMGLSRANFEHAVEITTTPKRLFIRLT